MNWRRKVPRADAASTPVPKAETPARNSPATASGRRRKLTFKEQQELAGIEDRIHAAETEVSRIEALMSDPEFHRRHGPKAAATLAELETARALTSDLYARWEVLEQIRSESSLPA